MSGDLFKSGILLPGAHAPAGSDLMCTIVIGMRGNEFMLEQRLPQLVQFDLDNPAHLFGKFVVDNASQIMQLAQQKYGEERRRMSVAANDGTRTARLEL